jgi:histidyl-tRNA synthetase
MDGPDIDAEMIFMTARMWEKLGLQGAVLQINSLGTLAARADYRTALVAWLREHEAALDEDSRRRLESNPLRILDSKNPEMQSLLEAAPKLPDYLDAESAAHFSALCALLDKAGLHYEVNPRLVRGLDYYSKTVFEWVTDQLGAQGTICAGGRYDGLVEFLGGKPTPAFGFALGLERLLALLEAGGVALPESLPHVYLVLNGDRGVQDGMVFAESLRATLPGLRLLSNCGNGSFKSQFKRADKSGAAYALVMGDDEVQQGAVLLKPLRSKTEAEVIPVQDVSGRLGELLNLG